MKRSRPYLMELCAIVLSLGFVVGCAPRTSAQEPVDCGLFNQSITSNNAIDNSQAVPGDIVTLSITTTSAQFAVTNAIGVG